MKHAVTAQAFNPSEFQMDEFYSPVVRCSHFDSFYVVGRYVVSIKNFARFCTTKRVQSFTSLMADLHQKDTFP